MLRMAAAANQSQRGRGSEDSGHPACARRHSHPWETLVAGRARVGDTRRAYNGPGQAFRLGQCQPPTGAMPAELGRARRAELGQPTQASPTKPA